MKHPTQDETTGTGSLILKPVGGGSAIVLTRPGVVLGRQSPPCAVPILHASVSREHCQIDIRSDSIIVTDLQSRNGTFVNGVPIAQSTLALGDTLMCGQYEMLVSRSEDSPAPVQ